MPQLNTHSAEAEARAAIQRDIERRENMRKMQAAQQAEVETARSKTWEETLADLVEEEAKILRQFPIHLGGLRAACERHIELQQEAGRLATAHGKKNPIYSMPGGSNIPVTPEIYLKRILERALRAMKSGAGLSLKGLEQP